LSVQSTKDTVTSADIFAAGTNAFEKFGIDLYGISTDGARSTFGIDIEFIGLLKSVSLEKTGTIS